MTFVVAAGFRPRQRRTMQRRLKPAATNSRVMRQLFSGLLITFVLLVPAVSEAAGASTMSLDASSYEAEIGKQFDAIVSVNPNGEALDTVRAVVTFDPAVLMVGNVSLAGAFNRIAPGNYYDNETGIVSWGAFTLEGPVTSAGQFVRVTFLPLTQGEGDIEISADSRAISNGEEKINVSELGSASVNVGASATSEPGVALIVVQSETHANDVDWYANNTARFSWTQLQGDNPITAYYYAFDESSDTDPTIYLASTTTEMSFDAVADGAHYLHIKGVHADGRETTTVHRRVNVDVTAPHPIELLAQDNKILEGESAWFTFATIDDTSGVLQYQIAINDSAYQVQESPLEMTDLQPGTYFFRVAALDRAGKASYGSASVRVYPAGTEIGRPEGYEETSEMAAVARAISEKVALAGERPYLLISILLGIVVIISIIYAINKRRIKS